MGPGIRGYAEDGTWGPRQSLLAGPEFQNRCKFARGDIETRAPRILAPHPVASGRAIVTAASGRWSLLGCRQQADAAPPISQIAQAAVGQRATG